MFWLWVWLGTALLAIAAVWLAHRRWPQVALGWPLSVGLATLLWTGLMVFPGGGGQGPWFFGLPQAWAETWGLQAVWDSVRWLTLLATATFMVVLIAGQAPAVLEHAPGPWVWTWWWLTVLLVAWSVVPATPTGVWWAWSVVDVAVLLLSFWLWPQGETRWRWLWQTMARSLTWMVALGWSALAPNAELTQPLEFPGARTLLLAAVLWRLLWPGPTRVEPPRSDFWQGVGRGWLAWVLLASSFPVLDALARWPSPSTQPWEPWFLGGLFFLSLWSGATRWLTAPRMEDAWGGLIRLWGGVGVLAAYMGQPPTALFWLGMAWWLGMALTGFRWAHRLLFPLWAFWAVMLIGLPFTSGQAGAWLWTSGPWWARGLAGFAVFMGLLAALPGIFPQGPTLQHAPRWVQVSYPAGLVVLALGATRWGLSLTPPDVPPPQGWGTGLALLALTALLAGLLWAQQKRLEQWSQHLAVPLRFFIGLLTALYRGLMDTVENALYFLSLVFEGESGLMWALAFLAALALFLDR